MADILIVDDSPQNCQLLEAMLKKCSHRIMHSYSGRDACSKAKTSHFDLIFMDIMMPVMDGIEAIGIIRKQGFRGKIIIVTADPSSKNALRGVKAGANGFLAKPITGNLCDIVSEFIS